MEVGVGALRQRLLVGLRGLLQAPQLAQQAAPQRPGRPLAGVDAQGMLHALQRLGGVALFGQGERQVAERFGVVRFLGERLAQHVFGFGEAPELQPRGAQVGERGRAPGHQRQRRREAGLGLAEATRLVVRQALQEKRFRLFEVAAHGRS
ncbi:MAG TPA: hypothetical protein VLI46_13030 [Ramlibacter sp.]|nr:hypothetical protein [Ramlibacter sp.]